MERPFDSDRGTGKFLVAGKNLGSGLKMSVMTFDFSDLEVAENEDIIIYDSVMHLHMADITGYQGKFIKQKTSVHPVVVPWSKINNREGQLTSPDNILSKEVQKPDAFKSMRREPEETKLVTTNFLTTMRYWYSLRGREHYRNNYGLALVNNYRKKNTPERFDAKPIRYFSYENVTTSEDRSPRIEVCYKKVTLRGCGPNDQKYVLPITMDTVLVEGEGNKDQSGLTVGQDHEGKKYRTVLYVDLETFDIGHDNFPRDAWLEMVISDSDRSMFDVDEDRAISIHQLKEGWNETTADWSSLSDKAERENSGDQTFNTGVDRLPNTRIQIGIEKILMNWLLSGENHGMMLKDESPGNHALFSFYDKETGPAGAQPKIVICQPPTPTTPTPAGTSTPIPWRTTSAPPTTTINLIGKKFKKCEIVDDPADLIHQEIDGKICVTKEKHTTRYCHDKAGRCFKQQGRNKDGTLNTECKCCLPLTASKVVDWQCPTENGESTVDIEYPLKYIDKCLCSVCGEDLSKIEEALADESLERRSFDETYKGSIASRWSTESDISQMPAPAQ